MTTVALKKGSEMTLKQRKKENCPLLLCFFSILLLVFFMSMIAFYRKVLKAAGISEIIEKDKKLHNLDHLSFESICPITSISALSPEERQPVADDERYMVTPPKGGKLHLLCCDTTKGQFNLLLHQNWAPVGVPHFLEMVEAGYFTTSRIPLFRCTDACQFGLAGDVNMTKRFSRRIRDDPQWLPPGPDHRENDKGVRRYPTGYFTHAGAGENSRSNQFVITLKPNRFMGGGSPWEVPMGELVGEHSFQTISRWYNGYGEKGPSQKLLKEEGVTKKVLTGWPMMDYIYRCRVTDEHDLG